MSSAPDDELHHLKANEVEPGEFAQLAVEELQGLLSTLVGINLRDISGTCPEGIKAHRIFRSSQVFKCAPVVWLNIFWSSILRVVNVAARWPWVSCFRLKWPIQVQISDWCSETGFCICRGNVSGYIYASDAYR